jgi:glutamyl-Q tRNA(Asp) synthetase
MPSSHRAASGYTGRFAPSPSGPLHAGSLVAAMASYLDARSHGGLWLLRIEDIDTQRIAPGSDRIIMQQLQALGMLWDGAPVWQSQRAAAYQSAFQALQAQGLVYGCACTRKDIDQALAAQSSGHNPDSPSTPAEGLHERPYPGTCRAGLAPGRQARAWRFRTAPGIESFIDRWLGPQRQDVQHDVGDFILKRADGLWAYQLAVVVDDGAQDISDIVRGTDLLDSTARQQMLARRLGIAYPRVMHVPLVLDAAGRKLSKQNHAPALDCHRPVETLNAAWTQLGFQALPATDPESFWRAALPLWAARFRL